MSARHTRSKNRNDSASVQNRIKKQCTKLAKDHYNLGMLYLGEEDYNEATTHFEMSLTCDDEFIPPRYEIMKILNEVDDDPKQALV